MASKSKQDERDRRAKVEAMRKAEAAKQRRRSIGFIVIAVVVGLGLVAAVAVPSYLDRRNDPASKALSSFGVSAAAASCSDVDSSETGSTEDVGNHVADGTVEEYETVPPSYGPHWAAPVFPARAFYSERDRPQMEQLVHNLEHGYTILWYDATVKGAQLDTLRDIAESARNDDSTGSTGKFVVSAWDDAYGEFPSGKHLGISHWGADAGHVQLCGKVSGSAVKSFIDDYPASDAPEPNAA